LSLTVLTVLTVLMGSVLTHGRYPDCPRSQPPLAAEGDFNPECAEEGTKRQSPMPGDNPQAGRLSFNPGTQACGKPAYMSES
jgi:hypothetical protein